MFEDKVKYVLDVFAPIKIIQKRKQFKNLVSDTVKAEMIMRDIQRDIARSSN